MGCELTSAEEIQMEQESLSSSVLGLRLRDILI